MFSRQHIFDVRRGWSRTKRRADALLIALAVGACGLIVTAGYWTVRKIERQVKDQAAETLETVVATTQEGIRLWIDTAEDPVTIIARRPALVSAVRSQLKVSSRPELLRQSSALRNLRELLAPLLELYQYNFAVVGPNRIQIAGRTDEQIGQPVSNFDLPPIQQALSGHVGIALSADPSGSQPQSVIVAAPVIDEEGVVWAALAFYFDPSDDLNEVTHRAQIGKTGETYIFDRYGHLLTQSRFRPERSVYLSDEADESNNSGQLTRLAKSALAGHSGVDVNGYPDYRGVEVFGAWSWNPMLQIGIATEIDRSEALTPYHTISALTLSMLVLIVGTFAVLLAVIRHRNRVVVANDLFQEAIRARQDTLAVVSHDLRAPLSNILLCTNMLTRFNSSPSDVDRFAGVVERSSRQMEKLISDLLDVSEIEMGHLRLEKRQCRVASLLDTVRDTFTEQARSRSIELSFSSPPENPVILVDPDRINQVLTNLVGNALKFTPEGGRISVTVTVLAREIRFEVQDSGPGISPEAIPHVFEQFWKARTSGKRGKGLGLYIAKMIVEQHSGKIGLESDGHTGSTFYFTLPCESRGRTP